MTKTLCVVLTSLMLAACGGKSLSEDVGQIRTTVNRLSWDVEALKQSDNSTAAKIANLSDDVSALKAASAPQPDKAFGGALSSDNATATITIKETPTDTTEGEPSAKPVTDTPAKPRIVIIEDMEMMGSTLYDFALALYKQKEYDRSAEKFEEFLSRFPTDALAPNAQYWLGENLYATKKYEGAVAAFKQVQRLYPDSAKAPDALLKEGYSYNNMGQRTEATNCLVRLRNNFPSSNAAKLAETTLIRWGA